MTTLSRFVGFTVAFWMLATIVIAARHRPGPSRHLLVLCPAAFVVGGLLVVVATS